MVLGISRLLNGFTDILEKIASWVGALFSIIPKVLYLLITFAMQIVDIIQLLFQKLAGLDVYYIDGSDNPETGDFLIYFLRKVLFEKGTLNTAFWSIVIVGLFLLVFATIVAVIRTQYNYDDKPVSPTKIVGKAFKALVSFAIVPIVAFFGVYLGNIFLNAINSATSSQPQVMEFDSSARIKLEPYTLADGTKTYAGINLFGKNIAMRQDTFSGMIFRASAYRANRIRNNADFRELCDGSKEKLLGTVYSGVTFGMFEVTSSDYETAASRLDDAFVYNYKLDQLAYVNWAASAETALTMSVGVLFNDFTAVLYASPYQTFSRYNVAWVWFYYDLWQFDYVLAIIAIVSCAVIYLNITSAMMKRAIELTMLMIVSPAVVAVTPLDGGAMQKRWRDSFIKKTLSAYGAVVGVNLLFLILPVIRNINFFNLPIVDTIVQLLFTIVGLTCIKDFMKMLSELAGGEDANAIGGEVNKKIADTAMKAGQVAASVAAPMAGAAKNFFSKSGGGFLLGKAGEGIGKGASAIGRGISNLAARHEANTRDKKIENNMIKDYLAARHLHNTKENRRIARNDLERARLTSGYTVYGKGENGETDYFTYDEMRQKATTMYERRRYKRPTSDLEQRERNSFMRKQMDLDRGFRSMDEYNAAADAYMASKEGREAVKRRRDNRKALHSPYKFVGTMVGQVVDETYGDKLYDGYKGIKNAKDGKETSKFGVAAAKDAKDAREKDLAQRRQEADDRRAEAQLTATQQTNDLLNQLLSRL